MPKPSDRSLPEGRFKAPIDFVRVLPIFEYDLPIPTAVALLALLDLEGWQSGLMVKPVFVFAEWTLDGDLWQTTFLGWRDDKTPTEIVVE
jgi:hypothetical protein